MALAIRRKEIRVLPTAQTVHLPAPTGGINAIDPAGAMPASDATVLWNWIAAEYGLRSRFGYRDWAKGLTGAADNLVRTIMPFAAAASGNNKLFATTSSGIWNVTVTGSTTTAWATATAYAVNDFVTASSTNYGCVTAGTSAASGALPSVWAATTAYVINDRVINNSNVYICTTGGTSAGSGGPSGTGTGIADGTVVWNYQSASTAVSDGTCTWRHFSTNTAPTLAIAFPDTAGNAGYGEWTVFVSITDGGHTLVYCDEVNGLYYYREASGTWAKIAMGGGATQISGVDPATFVFPIVYKGRLWFVERDSGSAWYLGSDTIYGAATRFRFGNFFRAGGHLVGLWHWTIDGGAGVDDFLVAVSSGGDVVIYQVTDPTSPVGIYQKGIWYAGGLPTGRRIATRHGGDLLLLTKNGILPLSRLVAGQSVDEGAQYTSYKISNLFASIMSNTASIRGWSMIAHPEDGTLLVTYPTATGAATEQLAMTLNRKGWSRIADLPIYSAAQHEGKLYFGTTGGKICINDGYVDAVLLADPNSYTDISCSLVTAFSNLGTGNNKQMVTSRTHFLSEMGSVPFKIEGRYDFDLDLAGAPDAATSGSGTWDSGVWDTAVWGGEYNNYSAVRGLAGMGRHFALALKAKVRARTVLAGFDVSFRQGGIL